MITTETGALVFDAKYNTMVDPQACLEYHAEIRREILDALASDARNHRYDDARYCLEELKTTDAEIARYRAMIGA